MSNTAYLYNAPAGFPGDVTRMGESTVVSVFQGAQNKFGAPYKLDGSGKAIPVASSDAATVVKGFVTRSVPSLGETTAEGFDDGLPSLDQPLGGLVIGFIAVKCTVGTPVAGGTVYMRITADTGKLVGDLEANSDGGNSVALVGVQWSVNGKDDNNVTEIRVNK